MTTMQQDETGRKEPDEEKSPDHPPVALQPPPRRAGDSTHPNWSGSYSVGPNVQHFQGPISQKEAKADEERHRSRNREVKPRVASASIEPAPSRWPRLGKCIEPPAPPPFTPVADPVQPPAELPPETTPAHLEPKHPPAATAHSQPAPKRSPATT